MEGSVLLQLALVIVVGIAAQWFAWRVRLPAIVLLLLGGIVMGPATGFLNPDAILGPAVVPIVSLAVAIILFEGGMSLRVRELRGTGVQVSMLVTVGAAVTWALGAFLAWWLLGLDSRLAVLIGAILIVTGPTVVGPLLRHVRPSGKSGTILKWEGLAIDPVGAIFAVLAFEYLFSQTNHGSPTSALAALAATLFIGALAGVIGALSTVVLLKRFWVPDFLINPVSVALVLLVFVGANILQAESGIVAVTIMGFVLANQRWVKVGHILEFKENLRVLLISSLFVILAARLSPEFLGKITWRHALFVLGLIAVVRPAAVLISTIGSGLSGKEKFFLSAMAPRGIVAAAVASVFALNLDDATGETMTTIVFLVIVCTVVFYGFAALPLARRLGLAQGEPNGLLFIGSNPLTHTIAAALDENGVATLIIDTNDDKVRQGVEKKLNVRHVNFLDDDEREELDVSQVGKLVAMTPNDNANEFLAVKGMEDFGRAKVYRLSRKPRTDVKRSNAYSGRVLFAENMTYTALLDRIESGWTAKSEIVTELNEQDLKQRFEACIPLVTIEKDGTTQLVESTRKINLKPGRAVVYLSPPEA